MLSTFLSWAISNDIAGALVTGKDRQAFSRKNRAAPLQNTYQTKDGRWIYLMVGQDPHWSRLCRVLERADLEHDPRFESIKSRAENHLALFDIQG